MPYLSPDRSDPTTHRFAGVAAVATAVAGLSLGSTMVKSSGSPGSVMAFWRLLLAAMIWAVVLAVRRVRPTWQHIKSVVPIGALFGINLLCFFAAVQTTRIAHAEFIGALSPVMILPVAALLFNEHVQPKVLACGAVALSGVALILLSAGGTTNWQGNALALAAVSTWAVYLLLTKKVRQSIDTSVFMLLMSIGAGLVAVPLALRSGKILEPSTKGWILIVAMALMSGVLGHGLYAWAQGRIALSTMALMQVSQPGLSTFWSWAILHETVRPVQFVGMAVVMMAAAAIALLSTRPRRTSARPLTKKSSSE